jgi:hypothetical protein
MRTLARVVATLVLTGVALSVAAQTPTSDAHCNGSRDIRLVNGRIHTMDARNSIVSTVTIRRGVFVAGTGAPDQCMKVINVHGRTVVPGLIDNHNHFVLLGERPGHDTRLESATSIVDVQAALRARGHDLPPTAWITAMGGWVPGQFAEKRLPTPRRTGSGAPRAADRHLRCLYRTGRHQQQRPRVSRRARR